MNKTVFKLTKPIEFGSDTITELHIKEPVANDYRGLNMESKDIGTLLDFAAKLTGKPPVVIGQLCNKDTFRLLKEVARFFEDGAEDMKEV